MFENGFLDHDLEDFRRLVNQKYKADPRKWVKYPDGYKVEHFSRRLCDIILWRCERDENSFT